MSYQTDHPMIPFLSDDLAFLYRNLLSLFIRNSVLDDATSLIKLSKIDPLSNVNQKQACDFEIGFGAREVVVEGRSKGLISPAKLLAFKRECRAFLATICQHIMEKSPLKSKFSRNASCVNPKMMATDSDASIKKYSVILEMLVQSKSISTKDADNQKSSSNNF